jgi:hypothetical protein
MKHSHANYESNRTLVTAQAKRLCWALGIYPLRQ